MKKFFFMLMGFTLIISMVRGDEGMWIPLFLGELNEAEMQAMGMRITAEDIYSINHSSLKDAIVLFGGGCTAQLISPDGLILTNHHCGNGIIQALSSLENDYLANGFWASKRSEELSGPGLKVTFLVRMEDVTDKVLMGIDESDTGMDAQNSIAGNIKKIIEEAVKDTHYSADVKPFFYGNRYFLFVNEVFEDVRLVGAPPSDIGNFGGDTDNWMYPRHTGDFSLFRIYADSLNRPAKYSEKNVPYQSKKHLTISTKGVQEGDFTFVFGYPGSTQQYIPSWAVDMQVNTLNPVRIGLRQKRLDIYHDAMKQSRETGIQYAAKRSGIANGWKKSIGESRGIIRLKTIETKQEFEQEFANWVNSSETLRSKYESLLPDLSKNYTELIPLNYQVNYLRESVLSIELIRYARTFDDLVAASKNKTSKPDDIQKIIQKLEQSAGSYFKNYQPSVDQRIFVAMMEDYYKNNDKNTIPEVIKNLHTKYKGDFDAMARYIYEKSVFASPAKISELLGNYNAKNYRIIEKDPAFAIAKGVTEYYNNTLLPEMLKIDATIDSLMNKYMQAQMEMLPMKKFYPDANLTLRITYGTVKGYQPADAITYRYYTTIDGIIEKANTDNPDYNIPEKLRELYLKRDFGPYCDKDGNLRTCFTATNHTTGGNSGSPVLDADGNLIGLNFDRCWEATMSDIVYDESLCRNIALDIRYFLFIVDKFAGAKHLIEEMTLIQD